MNVTNITRKFDDKTTGITEVVCASVVEVVAVVTETNGKQEVELWSKNGGFFINKFSVEFFKDIFKDNARVKV